MTFTPSHYGLYFAPDHVRQAHKDREREPLRAAWTFLRERKADGAESALIGGLRYRFDDDLYAGEQAIAALRDVVDDEFTTTPPAVEAVKPLLIQAHAFELLRDHRAFEAGWQTQWLERFAERVRRISQHQRDAPYVDSMWLNLLRLVAGIVLEREPDFEQAVETFQRIVREDIHPRGYILRAIGDTRDGGGLTRQLFAVAALALTAEAATHVGVKLWDYTVRSVSVMTACAYPLYYYYLPEKWTWDDAVATEAFRQVGGFWEIVNRRADFKDLKHMLDDLRPLYDPPGGGLTTLSHGVAKRRGLFGG